MKKDNKSYWIKMSLHGSNGEALRTHTHTHIENGQEEWKKSIGQRNSNNMKFHTVCLLYIGICNASIPFFSTFFIPMLVYVITRLWMSLHICATQLSWWYEFYRSSIPLERIVNWEKKRECCVPSFHFCFNFDFFSAVQDETFKLHAAGSKTELSFYCCTPFWKY